MGSAGPLNMQQQMLVFNINCQVMLLLYSNESVFYLSISSYVAVIRNADPNANHFGTAVIFQIRRKSCSFCLHLVLYYYAKKEGTLTIFPCKEHSL